MTTSNIEYRGSVSPGSATPLEGERSAPVRPDTLPIQSIQISQRERDEGRLSDHHRGLASLVLSCRGYVVLKDALCCDYVNAVRREMEAVLNDCRATLGVCETTSASDHPVMHVSAERKAVFWFRKSRWRIFPKLVPPLNDPRLLANVFVMPILERLLGGDLYCQYVSSDTCVRGAIQQSPHSDIDMEDVIVADRWQPRGYIVNVPVMECGLHNGPLEVWPGGSHMWSAALLSRYGMCADLQDDRNPPVEHAAGFFPSIKLALSPGEVLIRDLSMWHRGTPNPTSEPRTMLTVGYFKKSRRYYYGHPEYNLHRAHFAQLDPEVKRLFATYFGPSRRERVGGCITALLRRFNAPWIDRRLEALASSTGTKSASRLAP